MSNALRGAFSIGLKMLGSMMMQREQAKQDDALWKKRFDAQQVAISEREAAQAARDAELESIRQQGQTERAGVDFMQNKDRLESQLAIENQRSEKEQRRWEATEAARERRHQESLSRGVGRPSEQGKTIFESPDGSQYKYFGPNDEIPPGWKPKDVAVASRRGGGKTTAPESVDDFLSQF